jgi:uncharacterized delta-60 repeat protein
MDKSDHIEIVCETDEEAWNRRHHLDLVWERAPRRRSKAATSGPSAPSGPSGSPGSVDGTFGTNGYNFNTPKRFNDIIRSIGIQPDGKIVACGSSVDQVSSGNDCFAVTRYNSDGTTDTTFGTNGFNTTTPGDGDSLNTVAIQSSGKIVAGGNATLNGVGRWAASRYNVDGSLDTTFGNNGYSIFLVGTADRGIKSIAIQSDDKIVAGGFTSAPSGNRLTILRFNPDGTVDGTFNGGVINVTTPGIEDVINSVAIQSDGKIVAGGYYTDSISGNQCFIITRYNSDGTTDTTFGVSGYNKTTFGTYDCINSLAIQSDGKIVAGGYTEDPESSYAVLTVARYNSDGSLDTSFGTGGYNATTLGSNDFINSIAIQPDGKILAGGSVNIDGIINFVIARYNPDGSLDATFGTGGFFTDNISGNDTINSIAIQSAGKVVVGGCILADDNNVVFAVARYNF